MKSLHIWFVFFVQFSKVNRCFATTSISYHRSFLLSTDFIELFQSFFESVLKANVRSTVILIYHNQRRFATEKM